MPKLRTKVKEIIARFKKLKPNWGNILIFLGLAFILVGPAFRLTQKQNETIEETVFSEPIRADEALFTQKNSAESLPERIIIPSLNIDLTVRPAKVIKGKWELFEDTASFGLGSAEPGTSGNTVIFAHARKGLFLPLREIKTGERVYVLTKDKWFTYEVMETKEVLPNQIEVISPSADERLTLYTCSGFADSKRLIVTAKRV